MLICADNRKWERRVRLFQAHSATFSMSGKVISRTGIICGADLRFAAVSKTLDAANFGSVFFSLRNHCS
ncbi:hypothetical protein BDB00DRAFT_3954 [Zychaea mexicana]|uniref:uncharacterized protein n=1 Tax=Zychaea mexicana TaxID=64656 RepID=UPI0022FDC1E7|nr:uncharacterized protein BDB00DRAFT_3954 [Zychaea mexicana]KAI9499498.1 hypothetical protein BDB00DRAFT_3954 [Zychaea mexicana]